MPTGQRPPNIDLGRIARVGLLAVGLLSLVPRPTGADLNLERLECIELRPGIAGTGGVQISEQALHDAVLARLSARAPGLRLREGCANVLHARLILGEREGQEGRALGHFGAVRLELVRQVILLDTLRRTELTVWQAMESISGPPGDAAEAVLRAFDALVARFATAYQRSGNP
jgi:hypothetical protein